MKNTLLLAILLATTSTTAFASSFEDRKGDVHHNIQGFCNDLSTDIINVDVKVEEKILKVKMDMSKNISRGFGYREYYFWVGATPSQKIGYQPYNPAAVAWPDFYATNRVFLSLNGDHYTGKDKIILGTQDCLETDCSQDYGIRRSTELNAKISGNTVEFEVPRSLLPKIGNEKNVKFGFTTYYEFMQCNGEDDFPDWDENSLDLIL